MQQEVWASDSNAIHAKNSWRVVIPPKTVFETLRILCVGKHAVSHMVASVILLRSWMVYPSGSQWRGIPGAAASVPDESCWRFNSCLWLSCIWNARSRDYGLYLQDLPGISVLNNVERNSSLDAKPKSKSSTPTLLMGCLPMLPFLHLQTRVLISTKGLWWIDSHIRTNERAPTIDQKVITPKSSLLNQRVYWGYSQKHGALKSSPQHGWQLRTTASLELLDSSANSLMSPSNCYCL